MTTVRKSGDTLDEMEKPPVYLEALRAVNKTRFYGCTKKVCISRIFLFLLFILNFIISIFVKYLSTIIIFLFIGRPQPNPQTI